MAKAKYEKPASQVDLERRRKNGNKSDRVLSTSDFAEVSEEENEPGYVGVNPEYQNAASVAGRPGMASEGAEADVFEQFTGEEPEDVKPEDEDDDEGTSQSSSATTGNTSNTASSS